MPGMPAMPAMPSMPSISAGGGGPSSAQGTAGGTGGFDGSNWAVNFSGTQSTDQTSQLKPTSTNTQANGYALPQTYAYDPMSGVNMGGGGFTVTPTVLLGVAVVGLLLLRRRR